MRKFEGSLKEVSKQFGGSFQTATPTDLPKKADPNLPI